VFLLYVTKNILQSSSYFQDPNPRIIKTFELIPCHVPIKIEKLDFKHLLQITILMPIKVGTSKNYNSPKLAIISLSTSLKSICRYAEETTLEHLLNFFYPS